MIQPVLEAAVGVEAGAEAGVEAGAGAEARAEGRDIFYCTILSCFLLTYMKIRGCLGFVVI